MILKFFQIFNNDHLNSSEVFFIQLASKSGIKGELAYEFI